MSFRTGAGPLVGFHDDFSFFRNDIVREAHLTAVRRAGFEGICLNPGSPREIAAVHAALARHGLAFIAPTHRIDLTQRSARDVFDDLALQVRAAKALGAGEMTVAEAPRPALDATGWDRFCARLAELGDRIREAGVRLVYRPLPGTIVGDAGAIDRLMAATPASVGLMLDDAMLGEALTAVALDHGSRVALVAPGVGHDAVMALLPAYSGWALLDCACDHSADHLAHLRAMAA